MLRSVNWLARTLGLAWIGVLTFAIYPASGTALVVQAVGYGVAMLGYAGWAVADLHPRAAQYRSWALPAALAVMAAATGSASVAAFNGGTALVIFGLITTVIAGGECPLPAALAVLAANVLATEVTGLVAGASWGSLFGFPVIVASGLLIGRNRRAYLLQAEQSAALLAQREKLEAEQRRADVLDERARIAREIHDVLAHSLGALSIQIQAARSVLADREDIEKAGELLAGAQRMTAEGLAETRRAVHALRSGTLPLGEELATATTTHVQRYGVAASFATEGDPRPLSPEATVALLRIAQEALVNAAKHAPAQPVTLGLRYTGADIVLTIRNGLAALPHAGGQAAVSTANAGYGLTGMRERLRILNGSLVAGPDNGQWVVTARLPDPVPD